MGQTARASRYRFAAGKQSAEGTAQSTPSYEVSLYDGSIFPTSVENAHDVADSEDIPVGYWIESMGAGGDPVVSCDVDSLGLWLGAHFGTDTVSGTAAPYTHTFIRSYVKPFLTAYLMRPGVVGGTADVWSRSTDSFVQATELRAAMGKPLQCAMTLLSKKQEFSVTAPTPTADKRIIGTSPPALLTMIGSTVNLDLAATPSTTQVHNVENLISRSEYPNAAWLQTDAITGQYLDIGEWAGAVTADIVLQDYTGLASTFWGTSTVAAATLPGMALSPVVVYGSLDSTFQVGPTSSAYTLEIKWPALRFKMTPPTLDKSGAAQRAQLIGLPYKPSSGEVVTYVLKSTQSAAYAP